ncbi:MAG TPA: pyruvate dehydrogenase (acetyl-transferring) E1 component subunit alpha [Polyangiaceae bacterium]|nr:pyruvate dehydrogenase (acetyl-transferring) E1 component subunit alpha [Polyangiaceae bacterium]
MTTTASTTTFESGRASSGVVRVLREDSSLDPEHGPKLAADEIVALYRHMVLTRITDERLVTLQRQGRIGFHIGSLGEEAAIIGSAYAMRKQDWVFPCYREFGAGLLRGFPFQRYFDNMYGNQNDAVKGRQMPDHYTCREAKFGSVSSPIGTQITQATGFAWAAKIRREDLACLVYFGDGSTSSNEFHNGLNFAGVFAAPVVFFCRNNGWAISVPVERQTASRTFAEKGVAYGVPGVRVDGNDLLAVIAVTRKAVERAAAGQGPTLIEAITYRMSGHSTSDDPTRYRKQTELEPWVSRDPLERVRAHLEKGGHWDATQEEALRTELDKKIKDAVAIAESTPGPALETMFEDVFKSLPWFLKEQKDELLAGPRAPAAH